MRRPRCAMGRDPLVWAGATLLLLCTCINRVTPAEQSPAAWAILKQVADAYRDVYDLRFGYDAWVDYGDDGTVEATLTGKFLFRLHEQAFVQETRCHYPGGRPDVHYILSAVRGRHYMYKKEAAEVQGVLYRGTWRMPTWGAGAVAPLFDPLLLDRESYVAFLVGYERIGLRQCAHVLVVWRRLVSERRYRELLAMAARGDAPDERFGANYWVDTHRGVVLKYELVAYSREPGNERSELTVRVTRATDVRRFANEEVEIWLPVEVEEMVAPFWRYGPTGKVLVTRGYKKRTVVVPDTVEINPRAGDDAYVIEPPPGTRLQEEVRDVERSERVGRNPAEDFSQVVTVTRKMIEEAERQLREHGLEPARPRSWNGWAIGVLTAGAVLIAFALWLRRATNS